VPEAEHLEHHPHPRGAIAGDERLPGATGRLGQVIVGGEEERLAIHRGVVAGQDAQHVVADALDGRAERGARPRPDAEGQGEPARAVGSLAVRGDLGLQAGDVVPAAREEAVHRLGADAQDGELRRLHVGARRVPPVGVRPDAVGHDEEGAGPADERLVGKARRGVLGQDDGDLAVEVQPAIGGIVERVGAKADEDELARGVTRAAVVVHLFAEIDAVGQCHAGAPSGSSDWSSDGSRRGATRRSTACRYSVPVAAGRTP